MTTANPTPMIFVDVVDRPIEIADFAEKLADPDVGAHGWFAGVTRRTTVTENRVATTTTLYYEAQLKMAIAELTRIATLAASEHSLCGVVIVHRIGEVPIGQASVLVGCCSAHRRNTFAALPWVMDELKRSVPIWKKEIFVDGTTEWVHPVEGPTG